MARKLILSGVIGLAGRGTVAQSASAMLISFYFFDISFKYEPFEKPTLNRIKAFSEFQIFEILAVCTIIQAATCSAGVDFDSEEALTMDGYGALLIILPHAGIRPDHGAEPTTMSLCQLVLFWQPALTTSLCKTLHVRRRCTLSSRDSVMPRRCWTPRRRRRRRRRLRILSHLRNSTTRWMTTGLRHKIE